MGQVEETIAEIIGASPKPRGEGTWAWCRYYLIRARHFLNNDGDTICAQSGCPDVPTMAGAYCRFHSTPEQSRLRHERYMASLPAAPSRALVDDSEPF